MPRVLSHGDDHLVVTRVADGGALTGAAVAAVVAAVDQLAAVASLPVEEDGRQDGQREARPVLERARAAVALARLGVSPWRFLTVRRAATALPATVTIHGDLQPANILVAPDASVHLIDLELAGHGPAGWDLATLWPMLDHAGDRARLLAAIDERTPDRDHRNSLLRWLSLRYVGDLLRSDDPRLPAAVDRWREASQLR